MTALGVVRPRLRGSRSPPHDRRKARRHDHSRGPATIEFDHVDFSYPRAEEVSLASLESWRCSTRAPPARFCSTCRSPPNRSARGSGGAFGRRQDDHQPPGAPGSTTCARVGPPERYRRARPTLRSIHDVVGVVTQDAHLSTRRSGRTLVYAKPGATDDELVRRPRAAQILPLVESLPDGLDTLVGDRGYRLSGGENSGSPSPGCCSRRPTSWSLDEATAHLDSESGRRRRKHSRSPWPGRTSLVIATGCRRCASRQDSWWSTGAHRGTGRSRRTAGCRRPLRPSCTGHSSNTRTPTPVRPCRPPTNT